MMASVRANQAEKRMLRWACRVCASSPSAAYEAHVHISQLAAVEPLRHQAKCLASASRCMDWLMARERLRHAWAGAHHLDDYGAKRKKDICKERTPVNYALENGERCQ